MSDRPLTGSVALVTGGGKRIGKALALGLARAGADIAVHYYSSDKGAEDTVRRAKDYHVRAFAVQADLSTEDGVTSLFEQVDEKLGGKLDILVNSAARYDHVPIEELIASRWEHTLALNLTAPFLCAREAAVRMRRKSQGRETDEILGHIVNIADIAAERPWRGYAHYCVSKAGLVMLTRALAVELAPDIHVNAIAPGAILPEEGSSENDVRRMIERVPLGTLGSPTDVAKAALFLVTAAPYVTGQVITVDGGRSVSW